MNILLLASAVLRLSTFAPAADGVTDDTKAFLECFGEHHHRIMFHGRDVQNVKWRGDGLYRLGR